MSNIWSHTGSSWMVYRQCVGSIMRLQSTLCQHLKPHWEQLELWTITWVPSKKVWLQLKNRFFKNLSLSVLLFGHFSFFPVFFAFGRSIQWFSIRFNTCQSTHLKNDSSFLFEEKIMDFWKWMTEMGICLAIIFTGSQLICQNLTPAFDVVKSSFELSLC